MLKIDWTKPDHRALVVRAAAVHAVNARMPWTADDAVTMTTICLAESSGFMGIIGPVRKATAAELAAGLASPAGLMVGNANGTVDVSAWQINGAPEGLAPDAYAKRAYDLWKRRGWQPWVAWRNRATNPQWPLFEAAVAAAVKLTTLPPKWAEAAAYRARPG